MIKVKELKDIINKIPDESEVIFHCNREGFQNRIKGCFIDNETMNIVINIQEVKQ